VNDAHTARTPGEVWKINDAERAVLDAVHDTLCCCRQSNGLGMVIPHGGEDGALLAQTLTAQIERAGFRVVQA
jgi:hypothetical protein